MDKNAAYKKAFFFWILLSPFPSPRGALAVLSLSVCVEILFNAFYDTVLLLL